MSGDRLVELDLAAAIRALLRHPLVRAEVAAIIRESDAPAARAEGYIGTSEAARRADVKPDAVLGWISKGLLAATRPPGAKGWRIRPADLERFLAGESAGAQPVHSTVDLAARREERVRRLADAARRTDDGGDRGR
jgi:excisionase family DNA binding protein